MLPLLNDKQHITSNVVSNASQCHPSEAVGRTPDHTLLCSLPSVTWHSLCNASCNAYQASINLVLQTKFCEFSWKYMLSHHKPLPHPMLHATQLFWAIHPDALGEDCLQLAGEQGIGP